MSWTSDHKNQQEKWHCSFLLSHPHKNGNFWPFFTIQSQGIKQDTLRSVNDVKEGSTQEAHMCASCVLPRKVGKMV